MNFWFDATVAAKFMRASIWPVPNHARPSCQPATLGGSNSVCPMLVSGTRAESIENPFQPISLIVRITNSAGQAKRALKLPGLVNHCELKM